MSENEIRMAIGLCSFLGGLAIGFLGFLLFNIKRLKKPLKISDTDLLEAAVHNNYFSRRKLFKDDESTLYQQFHQIIGSDYIIFPWVHLAKIIQVRPDVKDYEAVVFLTRNLVADYVICSKDMTPMLVIMLTGVQNHDIGREERDKAVQEILDCAEIDAIHVNKNSFYPEEFELEIKNILGQIQYMQPR
jgi:hypothetical protein